MESDLKTTERLYERYLAATASDQEEQQLRKLLAGLPREMLTPQLRAAAAMLHGFEALRTEQMMHRPARRLWPRIVVSAGIAAALVLGIFFTARPTVYGYIDGRPVTDPAEAMAATACFEQLDGLTQSFDIAGKIIGTPEK